MSCDHIIGPARLLLEASSDPVVLFEHPVWTAPRLLCKAPATAVLELSLFAQFQVSKSSMDESILHERHEFGTLTWK